MSDSETKLGISKEQQEFTEWFISNYPGPSTVIHDPAWHAPKIWRSATNRLRRQLESTREELELEKKLKKANWVPRVSYDDLESSLQSTSAELVENKNQIEWMTKRNNWLNGQLERKEGFADFPDVVIAQNRISGLESSIQRMAQALTDAIEQIQHSANQLPMMSIGRNNCIALIERLQAALTPSPDPQTPSPQRATGVNEHWCTDSDEITRSGPQRADKEAK